jgi:membrane-bound lytic murein transglycosylase D
MKKIFLAINCLLLASLVNAAANPEDSTNRRWDLPVMGVQTVIVQESNVVYPELLQDHESKSLAYVEKFASTRKDYLIRTYKRSKKLFPKAAQILKKYNVPQEFKVLLALESGFNPNALSKAGAFGYWQLMDEVAKEYGLKIVEDREHELNNTGKKLNGKTVKIGNSKTKEKKKQVDQRSDFLKSTQVAARYLKDRAKNLNNDWLLIAASYNWGVGNVWDAMKRTGLSNPGYWDIEKYVPAETKAYVLNFITLNVIFNNYEKFASNQLCFKTVTEEQPCIADQADMVRE